MAKKPSTRPAQPRVYIVDDEWDIAETLAAILSRNGFLAQAFHSPNRALVRALDQPPDILLTDVMMPDLSGLDLAIALRRAGLPCRILLFSGQPDAASLLLDAHHRGYDFELLDKPLHPMQLLLRLRNTTSPRTAPSEDPVEETVADPTANTVPAA